MARFAEKKKGPNSQRAYWIQQCADLTGMTWRVVWGKTMHLPTKWIQVLWEDAQAGKDADAKRKKFWWLLKQTKVKKTK